MPEELYSAAADMPERGSALCQVVNDTQLRLEVALVEVQRQSSARSSPGFGRADSMVCPCQLKRETGKHGHHRPEHTSSNMPIRAPAY